VTCGDAGRQGRLINDRSRDTSVAAGEIGWSSDWEVTRERGRAGRQEMAYPGSVAAGGPGETYRVS